MSKRLGGIIGYENKPLHGIQTGSPIVVTLGQQYNVEEKPTVKLHTYINRHGGTPKKNLTDKNIVVIVLVPQAKPSKN